MPSDIQKDYQKLVDKLHTWNQNYYLDDSPVVEDAVYDACMQELLAIEKLHPELVVVDSPSQLVGAKAKQSKFAKLEHLLPMISLANAFGESDIRDWEERINKIIGEETYREYVFELKIDGLSIAIDYNQGHLLRAATRGDGRYGEDVTENIRTIKTLPQTIKHQGPLAIRGEVFISKENFKQINVQQVKNSAPLYANPRNTAAGSLRQLDPKVTASRNLDAFFYNLFTTNALSNNKQQLLPESDINFTTHYQTLEYLQQLGFKTNAAHNILCKNIDQVIQLYSQWQDKKNTLDYDIDGAVVKINQFDLQRTLGSTAKTPRWAIALKFTAEIAETQIESVENEVGRLGTITPVANLTPVQLGGTTVKRATLHNFDQIAKLDVRVGDWVQVRKAGEIIPEIIAVNLSKRNQHMLPIVAPSSCPVCRSPVERSEVSYYCINIAACPAQVQRRIEHWCSKAAMDISGVGPALIKELLTKKLINTPLDLYDLTRDNLINLERMAEKSAINAINSINLSRNRSFARLLYALGIKHIGVNVAELIADYYSSLSSLELELQVNRGAALIAIDGLGPKIVESLQEFFASDNYQQLKLRLAANPNVLDIEIAVKKKLGDRFSGLTFVITGSLNQSRSYYEDLIKANAGKVSSSISKKTSYLLCGNDAGSKLDKAQEFGVRIINEKDLEALLK